MKIPSSMLAVAAFALTSCDRSDDAASSPSREPTRPFLVKDDGVATKVARSAAPQAQATVSLLPDGLIVGGARKGAKMALVRFGDGQAQVISALSGPLGNPRQSANPDCEAGPMRFADFGEIRLNFIDGRFAGWFAERGQGLNTGEGLGPDWPFSRLERIGASRVEGSTLDGEFTMANERGGQAIGGFVDKSGKVASLYAGGNCFFR